MEAHRPIRRKGIFDLLDNTPAPPQWLVHVERRWNLHLQNPHVTLCPTTPTTVPSFPLCSKPRNRASIIAYASAAGSTSQCLCILTMASLTLQYYLTLFIFFFSVIASFSPRIQAQADETSLKAMRDALEWPMSMYFDESSGVDDGLVGFDDGVVDDEESSRRSLFWRGTHYYISYGALSANRIPCPARSGRSYYSHNCFNSRAPVNPYSRGCSRITRCRR
uniref:Protein RALF-like 34 n=1 Tax=Salix viminalis TaxID=40686 RepID=A0A6N2N7C2_SALVM